LLSDDRTEVRKAAIVSLRELRVEKTYPSLVEHIAQVENRRNAIGVKTRDPAHIKRSVASHTASLDEEIRMTLQALADLRVPALESEAKRFGRKHANAALSVRCAALWSLGMLHRDAARPAAQRFLEDRLNDKYGNLPEMPAARRASAIALGWMRATGAVEALREASTQGDPDLTEVGPAAAWAIERITGQSPAIPPEKRPVGEWFLRPARN
jgi:HEAT repeat protein